MQPKTLLFCLALAGSMAWAQVVTSIQQTAPQGAFTMGFSGGPGVRHVGPPVTGMPYSADEVMETVQALADGTHIRQNGYTWLMYRDSQGRTRRERHAMSPPGAQTVDRSFVVQITDVVGGYEYTLDEVNKVAHRVAIQTLPPPKPATLRSPNGAVGSPAQISVIGSGGGGVLSPVQRVAPNSGVSASGQRVRPEMQWEDLGTRSIEGVTARGRRNTETWPVGAVGNDRPIVTVHENWISDQLGGMLVLSKHTDPRYGEQTTALKNISLTEPDPALFQPPPGYQIVDEAGQFNIRAPRESGNTLSQ